jgi:hypothetical protein
MVLPEAARVREIRSLEHLVISDIQHANHVVELLNEMQGELCV